jgi:flagellin-like protein
MQKKTARKAVDPIIASLLLIAIAVAAGIIVYVYVNSLAGGLTSGGGQQVSDQIAMDAYNFQTLTAPSITVRDVGSTTVTIGTIFIDGQPATLSGTGTPSGCASGTATISPTTTCQFTLTTSGISSGTAHTIKILTTSGGTSIVTIIAGKTG